MQLPRALAFAAVAFVVLGATLSACDDDDPSDAGATPGGSTPPAAIKTPDADGVITIVANNLAFDTDELRAPAGAITIVLDNRDSGTPHNVHFFAGEDTSGESAGETAIENGRTQTTLQLDLSAGSYYYQCDVHPNMHGTLTVAG